MADLLGPAFTIVSVGRRRLDQRVANQIRQAIFRGLIGTGHKLPSERQMADEFQISRVTLRQALRSLEKEGLITVRCGAGGGAFVASLDMALNALAESLNTIVKLGSAQSAYLTELRCILEPDITRLATLRATPKDLRAIEAVVLAQEKELDSGELSRKLDMDFHSFVANAARNPAMNIVINAVNQAIRGSIIRYKPSAAMRKRVVSSHRKIFEAIRSGNSELAGEVMGNHVVDVQCHLEASDRAPSS